MSPEIEKLRKCVKQLQNANTNEERVDILRILKTDFQVNDFLLRATKAGLAVGRLRAHDSKEVSDLAKEVVRKWKYDVHKAKSASGSPGKGKQPVCKQFTSVAMPTSVNSEEVQNAKADGPEVAGTSDHIRDRCTELIHDGFAWEEGPPSGVILKLAVRIEEAVFSQFNGTTAEYKGKVRSLFIHLKDKASPGLRESIVSGELSPEKFSMMTREEISTTFAGPKNLQGSD